MVNKNNIMYFLKELVKIPSITGTSFEKDCAQKIYDLLAPVDFFRENPMNLKLVPLDDDYLERSIVSAFLPAKVKTEKTVIITGHYDVVGIEEYGHLQEVAFEIDQITKRISELEIDEKTADDIAANDWLFGRGVADMKYGLALGIECLRYFSEEETLPINLLLLAVPGEETNSAGMLKAVKIISNMQETMHLEFISLLNTEAFDPDEADAGQTRYIHIGSSGKIMPLFFFCGVGTHAGEMAFDGFDPNLMAARLHEQIQHNPDFCQQSRGKTTPPPSCLKMGDLKETYSITTPMYAASYYNIITLNLNIEEMVRKLKKLAVSAFHEAIRINQSKVDAYNSFVNGSFSPLEVKPHVVMFTELYQEVKEAFDGDFDDYIKKYSEERLKEKKELQDVAIQVFKYVIERHPNKEPKIVIGFIPPYYPDNYPDENNSNTKKLNDCIVHIINYSEREFHEKLCTKDYYMGLSDMCYVGMNPELNYEKLIENIVGVNSFYEFPLAELRRISIPAIIFGPYGKDAHKATERLNVSYNFDVLPSLFTEFIKAMAFA